MFQRPPLARIGRGEIDPTFVVTHRLPLAEAARGDKMFCDKLDGCEKVVLKAWRSVRRPRARAVSRPVSAGRAG